MIDIEILNKALSLAEENKLDDAEEIYIKLLQENPDDYILLSVVGLFYAKIQNYNNATYYLNKACSIKKTPGTMLALGTSLYEQEEYKKAAEVLEETIATSETPDAYNKLILSLFKTKNFKKAIDFSALMYKKFPNNTDAIAHMVKSLTHSGKLLEAEKLCVEFLKEHPDSPSLWFHLGYLKELIYSDDKQALECYKIALDCGSKEAYYNIAVSYQKQRNFAEAENFYNKMLENFPNDNETLTSFGMCKLTQKKFKEGYDLFFLRNTSALDKKIKKPWQPGQNLEKEVLILPDQGFGDQIQFVRYLPLLNKKTEKIYAVINPALKDLFAKNYPFVEFIDIEKIKPEMQSIRITDLAYALNIDFENIPYSERYLNVEPQKIDSNKIKIGLCWEAGSAGIRTMINRTINPKLLEKIIKLENIQTYSFQVNDSFNVNKKYTEIINLAENFKNFEDTAKAMESMDIIITVDTSVAHLAGALGIKTFLMLPYSSDWRWFEDTKKTPWYNSIEIFKQIDPISWEQPIEEIICKIKNFSS